MAAVRLASAGKEVTLLERRILGGQCVHDGCMLVCGLNDVARSIRNSQFLKERGVISGETFVNYPAVIQNLEAVQARLAKILERETLDAGVSIEYGVTAEVSGKTVIVNGVAREAESVIIATGANVHVPDILGKDLLGTYTPRTIKSMPKLPKRMVIVGGGISAAEFAYIFSAFGVEVTVLARSRFLSMLPEKLLKGALNDLSDVSIHEFSPIEKILGEEFVEGVVFQEETIPCDAVLFTCGMQHESSGITGIDKNPDGSIKVNEKMETSVPNVYACGDVIGSPYFTPVSRLQGFAAADAILGRPRRVDISQFPFTVVLGTDYTVFPSLENGHTIRSPNIAGPETFWHVADASIGRMELTVSEDGHILGFATSAPGSGLVGTYLGYLVRKGVNVHDFSELFEVHPISDGLYSLIRMADEEPREK